MIENVYDYIFKRKSTRKYKMDALPKDQLREIKDFADKLVPLYGQIKVEYEIAHSVKGLFS
ncbi:MAG: nitroreductase, partial [Firmicutes bacterium]|nr:nitroreductase [Bacillota bacterium]